MREVGRHCSGRSAPGRGRRWPCLSRASSASPASWRWSRRTRPAGPGGWQGRLGSIARLAGGVVLVVGALLGVFAAIGGEPALRGLYRDVVRGSLGFVDFEKTLPSFGSELGAFLMGVLGLVLVLRVRGVTDPRSSRSRRHPGADAGERRRPPAPVDAGGLPARVVAATPGGRRVRGPRPRHAGGVGAAGSHALASRDRRGGDRGRRRRSGRGVARLRREKPERLGAEC